MPRQAYEHGGMVTSEQRRPAVSPRRFRRTFAVGVAVPLVLAAAGYAFITVVVRPSCLRQYGTLGACDPLSDIDRAAIAGQLALALMAIIVAVLASAPAR